MSVYEESVVEEKAQLEDKLAKLNDYLQSQTFTTLTSIERFLLQHQQHLMKLYAEVLKERIALFR